MQTEAMEYDITKAAAAQAKYCRETSFPYFAPSTGSCFKCKRNIYERVGWRNEYSPNRIPIRRIQVPINSPEVEFITGIPVEKAATKLITGCPHCNRSYCD